MRGKITGYERTIDDSVMNQNRIFVFSILSSVGFPNQARKVSNNDLIYSKMITSKEAEGN